MKPKADSTSLDIILLFLPNSQIFRVRCLPEIFKIIKVVFKDRNIERKRKVLEWSRTYTLQLGLYFLLIKRFFKVGLHKR